MEDFIRVFDIEDVLVWEFDGCTLEEALLESTLGDEDCPPEFLDLEEGSLFADIYIEGNKFVVVMSDYQVHDEDSQYIGKYLLASHKDDDEEEEDRWWEEDDDEEEEDDEDDEEEEDDEDVVYCDCPCEDCSQCDECDCYTGEEEEEDEDVEYCDCPCEDCSVCDECDCYTGEEEELSGEEYDC